MITTEPLYGHLTKKKKTLPNELMVWNHERVDTKNQIQFSSISRKKSASEKKINWLIEEVRVLVSIDRRTHTPKKQVNAAYSVTMNCATMVPDDRFIYEKDRSTDRRTSRGLASCLRGESEEYYDYEAEGNFHFLTIPFSQFCIQRLFCLSLVQMKIFWNSISNTETGTIFCKFYVKPVLTRWFIGSEDGAQVSASMRKSNSNHRILNDGKIENENGIHSAAPPFIAYNEFSTIEINMAKNDHKSKSNKHFQTINFCFPLCSTAFAQLKCEIQGKP